MSIWDRPSLQTHSVAQDVVSDMGGSAHPRLSILGGKFTMVDAAGQKFIAPWIAKNTPRGQKVTVLGIIIGSNPKKSRIYYENAYDPQQPTPPDCFSDNGIAPSSDASSPQARTCAECTWQKWGSEISEISGKGVKACNEKKKVAVLIIGDGAMHSYEFQVPPKSLANLMLYSSKVQQVQLPGATRKADLCDLVTEITFADDQPHVIEFGPHCLIDCCYIDDNRGIQVNYHGDKPAGAPGGGAEIAALMDEIWQSDELDDVLGLKDIPWTAPAGYLGPGSAGIAQMPAKPQAGAVRTRSLPAASTPAPAAVAAQAPSPANPFAPPAGMPGQQPQDFAIPGATAPAQAQQQAAEPAAQKRTRAPRGSKAGAGAGATPAIAGPAPATAGVQEDIPAFLQRNTGGANPPNGGHAAGTFGTAEPQAPTNQMEATLAAVFNMPKR